MKKEEAKQKAKHIFEEVQGGVNEVIPAIREFINQHVGIDLTTLVF